MGYEYTGNEPNEMDDENQRRKTENSYMELGDKEYWEDAYDDEGGFFCVPHYIYNHFRGSELLFLSALFKLENRHGGMKNPPIFWATNKYIKKLTGLSYATIAKVKKSLRRKKAIIFKKKKRKDQWGKVVRPTTKYEIRLYHHGKKGGKPSG